MAPKRGIKRKDKSRVVLKKGESQRKDGTYDYRWTSRNGRRHSIYAQTLEELRIKEDAITRDEMDGIRAEARCTTLNELFEVWAQVKRGLKDNTYTKLSRTFIGNSLHLTLVNLGYRQSKRPI